MKPRKERRDLVERRLIEFWGILNGGNTYIEGNEESEGTRKT